MPPDRSPRSARGADSADRSLLLIELLDGLGAHEIDGRLRAHALRRAGWRPRAVAIPPADDPGRAGVIAAVCAEVRVDRPAEIWIAGSRDGAAAVARALPRSAEPRWWPTVVRASGGEPAPGAGVRVALPAAPERALADVALDLAVVTQGRAPGRGALWDGAFVLVPAPLEGAAGRAIIEAFARLAEWRSELDLVVLSEPEPSAERLARSLGVYPRIHFAGPAPRAAEQTWIATASAVALPLNRPVSAGFVLRVLAEGTALVPFGNGEASALGAWLGARLGGAPASPESALVASLTPDAAARGALERGRGLAAAHEPDALAARLAAPPPGDAAREVA